MTECEKMKLGLWYDANYDAELLEQRADAEELCFLLNQTSPKDTKRREEIIRKLLPNCGENVSAVSYTHLFQNRPRKCGPCAAGRGGNRPGDAASQGEL